MHEFEIVREGVITKVFMDGLEISKVYSVTLERHVDSLDMVTLSFLASKVTVKED